LRWPAAIVGKEGRGGKGKEKRRGGKGEGLSLGGKGVSWKKKSEGGEGKRRKMLPSGVKCSTDCQSAREGRGRKKKKEKRGEGEEGGFSSFPAAQTTGAEKKGERGGGKKRGFSEKEKNQGRKRGGSKDIPFSFLVGNLDGGKRKIVIRHLLDKKKGWSKRKDTGRESFLSPGRGRMGDYVCVCYQRENERGEGKHPPLFPVKIKGKIRKEKKEAFSFRPLVERKKNRSTSPSSLSYPFPRN